MQGEASPTISAVYEGAYYHEYIKTHGQGFLVIRCQEQEKGILSQHDTYPIEIIHRVTVQILDAGKEGDE